ncbi:MAG: hypothetical protein ABL952_12140 [Pyrinomonadaceae bacterium]
MKFAPLILIVLLASGHVIRAQNCFVKGVAVDADGSPLPGAKIIAYSPPQSWEDLIEFQTTRSDGLFLVPATCRSRETRLYLIPPFDERSFTPIQLPVSSHTDNRFLGKILRPIHSGTLNVGKVVVPDFRRVQIKMLSAKGSLLVDGDDNREIWIRIRGVRGTWAYFFEMPFIDDSTIMMLLPTGSWLIDARFAEKKGPIFSATRPLTLTRETPPRVEMLFRKVTAHTRGKSK